MATFGEHVPKPCNPKTCGTTSWLDTHIALVTRSSEIPWVHHQFHWLNVCVRRPSNWTLTSSYSHPHIGSSGPRTPYLISSSPLCSSPQPIICLHLSLSSASASSTLPNFMYSSSINLFFALPRGLLSAKFQPQHRSTLHHPVSGLDVFGLSAFTLDKISQNFSHCQVLSAIVEDPLSSQTLHWSPPPTA